MRDAVFVVPRETTLRDVLAVPDVAEDVPRDAIVGRPDDDVVAARDEVVVVAADVTGVAAVRETTARDVLFARGDDVVIADTGVVLTALPRDTMLEELSRDVAGRDAVPER